MILTLLRKPLEGSVADNTIKHGCGAINIDSIRIPSSDNLLNEGVAGEPSGRWPANFALIIKDGLEDCPVKELDRQSGASRFFKHFKLVGEKIEYFKKMISPPIDDACVIVSTPDEIDFSAYKREVFEGGALIASYEPMVHGLVLLGEPTEEQAKEIIDILKSGAHIVLIPEDIGYKGVIALEDQGFEVRDTIFVAEEPNSFYYTSKASRSEREEGLTSDGGARANTHPTVKPIDIMGWCARDIEKGSKVVDPFLGSGTTGIAMSRLGNEFTGIELNPNYAKICEARIRHWMPIGTEIKSEAGVGRAKPKKGEQLSIFDIFGV